MKLNHKWIDDDPNQENKNLARQTQRMQMDQIDEMKIIYDNTNIQIRP